MNLHPKNSDMQHLSMHHAALKFPAGNEFYAISESSLGHLVLRIPESGLKSAAKAIKAVTKLAIPTTLQSEVNDDYALYWISPDEFLLLTPERTEADVEAQLRDKMESHFAISDVTGGQTVVDLSGERAEEILKKSSVYDVHITNFPIGKVVTTQFAKAQLVLARTGTDSFKLIIRRSFSDYIWQWIADAGSRP